MQGKKNLTNIEKKKCYIYMYVCMYVKLKPLKMNMYRQYFYFDFSLFYYLVITSKLK